MSEMTTDMAVIYDAQARNLAVSTSSSGSKDASESSKAHRKVKSTGTIELNNLVSASKATGSHYPFTYDRNKTATTTSSTMVGATTNSPEDSISKIWKRLESLEMRMEDLHRETLALRVEQEKLYKQLQSLVGGGGGGGENIRSSPKK